MLRSVESILGYQVSSRNGMAGSVTDVLFANDLRSVRFLVVLTGGWLDRRSVLIPVEHMSELITGKMEIHSDLTLEEIQEAPTREVCLAMFRLPDLTAPTERDWLPCCLPDPLPGIAVAGEIGRTARLEPHTPRDWYKFPELRNCEAEIDGRRMRIHDAIVCDLDWSVSGLVVSAGSGRNDAENLIVRDDLLDICWESRVLHVRKQPQPKPFVATSPINPRRVLRYFDYCGHFHHAVIAGESRRSNCACSDQ